MSDDNSDGAGELEVFWSDQVQEAAAKDPELAEFLRNVSAIFRQADCGVTSGQYKDLDEALEILAPHFKKVDDLEEDDDL